MIDDRRRLRVLLVEDSWTNELLIRAALELDGLHCEFLIPDTGKKAMEFIEKLDGGEALPRPDLVLLDLNPPGRGGGRILRRITHSRNCAGVPVFVLASSDPPQKKTQASHVPETRYFRKPFDLMEFMKLGPIVRGALDQPAA